METKQTSPFFIKIKGIAKKLLSAYRACTRLVTVHFQEKLTLDKLRDALQYALCGTLTLAEYHAIISVAHKRMTAFGQFLVQFVEHDVTQQST